MCQEDAGPSNGPLYLTIDGHWVKLRGINASHRCTLVCLTFGTGDAVLFISVHAAKEFDVVARFGYGHWAIEPFGRVVKAAEQVGDGKAFPWLPQCE